MIDARKLKRMHVISYIRVTERNSKKNFGSLVDITTEGMRMCGDEPIEPNTTYHFVMILPRVDRGEREIQFDANVVWCKKDAVFEQVFLYAAGFPS